MLLLYDRSRKVHFHLRRLSFCIWDIRSPNIICEDDKAARWLGSYTNVTTKKASDETYEIHREPHSAWFQS